MTVPLPEPDMSYVIDGPAKYNAQQMHQYAAAENAALHTQVRVLREALVMCSTAGDGLTLAQEAQIRAALGETK
ncbi:hypothetical protein UFOVP1147_53 [uncultured Caudovirales phage]|uniref:Uncharacterized protein n=1 Tax=uncultured Caudovirales phage TaxID=2100421 RepID=A0A6J5MGV4_9CAUD|nr:hypothetical protein UFOVP484_20 [uncultured Caudovirales phage]CAB4163659.1 hypothetical protein UFOVP808_36 [uncultured Caudovirales phage]CAB4175991.1 hypothetical protein UFOVP994_49 [uncultured Caudovirales phage]CAB4186531.1 hypothetical protein UFOVP1147_53 [uncultured Caudovirales phage]CAB4217627.1 hypothetical protein UFOVP1594_49 [uncultured Caudovirales phage]